jgi:hypothetical protein
MEILQRFLSILTELCIDLVNLLIYVLNQWYIFIPILISFGFFSDFVINRERYKESNPDKEEQ